MKVRVESKFKYSKKYCPIGVNQKYKYSLMDCRLEFTKEKCIDGITPFQIAACDGGRKWTAVLEHYYYSPLFL